MCAGGGEVTTLIFWDPVNFVFADPERYDKDYSIQPENRPLPSGLGITGGPFR